MSRQFKLHKAPPLEYAKSAVGGVFMGAGAVLAAGCNVGGFYTAAAMLDFGGVAMMAGLIIGAWIGLPALRHPAALAKSALGESAVSCLDGSRGLDAVSLGTAWPALMRAALLSFFLFALPSSV